MFLSFRCTLTQMLWNAVWFFCISANLQCLSRTRSYKKLKICFVNMEQVPLSWKPRSDSSSDSFAGSLGTRLMVWLHVSAATLTVYLHPHEACSDVFSQRPQKAHGSKLRTLHTHSDMFLWVVFWYTQSSISAQFFFYNKNKLNKKSWVSLIPHLKVPEGVSRILKPDMVKLFL